MITWCSQKEMYVPKQFSQYWFFQGVSAKKEYIDGGIFITFYDQNTFLVYMSLSEKSDAGMRLTRVTMDKIPGLSFPYEITSFGYYPNDPDLSYLFTTKNTGLGSNYFLDWQIYAENPMPHKSVYPGAIYVAGTTLFGNIDLEALKNTSLNVAVKGQGKTSLTLTGNTNIVPIEPCETAVPEMPQKLYLVTAFILFGYVVYKRMAR
ncbi:hypothetical protein OMAG_001779 [Candidatus Omnitrophus magneticus]|uniref:Uncharacterized protein n=1 Tax=Candidatus Omnitrophus magneticus TaxID=1609969 RepID=A0A0F0CS31_9BACT|nr:hypothetical protein OMAG_001779 [Candidatus Omnitrophus magneticus]